MDPGGAGDGVCCRQDTPARANACSCTCMVLKHDREHLAFACLSNREALHLAGRRKCSGDLVNGVDSSDFGSTSSLGRLSARFSPQEPQCAVHRPAFAIAANSGHGIPTLIPQTTCSNTAVHLRHRAGKV